MTGQNCRSRSVKVFVQKMDIKVCTGMRLVCVALAAVMNVKVSVGRQKIGTDSDTDNSEEGREKDLCRGN